MIQLGPHCHSDTETTINYPQLNTSLFGVYNFVIQPPLIIGNGLYRNLDLIDIVGLIENEASNFRICQISECLDGLISLTTFQKKTPHINTKFYDHLNSCIEAHSSRVSSVSVSSELSL